jgi:hypothetical protein
VVMPQQPDARATRFFMKHGMWPKRPTLYPWNTGKSVCWNDWGRIVPCHPAQTKHGAVLLPEDE